MQDIEVKERITLVNFREKKKRYLSILDDNNFFFFFTILGQQLHHVLYFRFHILEMSIFSLQVYKNQAADYVCTSKYSNNEYNIN